MKLNYLKKKTFFKWRHSSKVLLKGIGSLWIKSYALAKLEETVGEGKKTLCAFKLNFLPPAQRLAVI